MWDRPTSRCGRYIYASQTALMLMNWANLFIDIQLVEHESRRHRRFSISESPLPFLRVPILTILNSTDTGRNKLVLENRQRSTNGWYFGVIRSLLDHASSSFIPNSLVNFARSSIPISQEDSIHHSPFFPQVLRVILKQVLPEH